MPKDAMKFMARCSPCELKQPQALNRKVKILINPKFRV